MYGRINGIKNLRTVSQPKRRSILGIDITSTAVKLVEISVSGETLHVESYGYEALPPQALTQTVINDINAVAASIRRLVNRLQSKSKQVVLAVPDAVVITRIVQINAGLSDEEMEELVAIEADKYIPYPITEINLDFEILGYSEKNPSVADVLLVASRIENLTQRVEVIKRAGLEANIVDVESYAVERAAWHFAKTSSGARLDNTLAIIDFSERGIHLYVLHRMKLIYSQAELFDSMPNNEAIAQHLEINLNRSDQTILNPFKEKIVVQLRRTLNFFYASSQQEQIDQVLVAGDWARFPGIESLIQEQLGMAVTVANPFTSISCASKVDVECLYYDAPAFMVAFGLALRCGESYCDTN